MILFFIIKIKYKSKISSSSRHKLDKKLKKCVFVGYSPQSKAYRLYNPISGKVIISRDVKFNEKEKWTWSDNNAILVVLIPKDLEIPTAEPLNVQGNNSSTSSNFTLSSSPSTPASPHSPSSPSSITHPKKTHSLREAYASCSFALYVFDPTCYDEVAKSQVWQDAMHEKISTIQKNKTWELVDLPKIRMLLGSSGYIEQSTMLMVLYKNTKLGWWPKDTRNSKASILKKLFLLWHALKQ